jgi:hypothetical protein
MSLSRREFHPCAACLVLALVLEHQSCREPKWKEARNLRKKGGHVGLEFPSSGTWTPPAAGLRHSLRQFDALEKYLFLAQHATAHSLGANQTEAGPKKQTGRFLLVLSGNCNSGLVLVSLLTGTPNSQESTSQTSAVTPPTKTAQDCSSFISKSAPPKNPIRPKYPAHFRDLAQLRFHERASSIPSIDPRQRNFGGLRMHWEEEPL